MKKETKVFSAEVKEFSDEDLTVTHFISTERKDRGGDIMHADGMKMTGRPVVLLIHGFTAIGSEPIAKPVWIRQGEFKKRKGIEAKTQFYNGSHLTPPDNTGQRLYEKTKNGFMPNWSIGYIPVKWEFEKDGKSGDTIRHVHEWELLEYSPVGVPMNPDAQTPDEKVMFKVLPEFEEGEEKYGELIAYKDEDGNLVELKPYPNEHSCRLEDPGKYIRFRRENDKFGSGIHAIWGVQGGGKPVELQAIRLDKAKFTAAEARKWCKDHDHSCKPFEPASEKCAACGADTVVRWSEDVSGENAGKTCDPDVTFEYICEKCEAVEAERKRIEAAAEVLVKDIREELKALREELKELKAKIDAMKPPEKRDDGGGATDPPEPKRLEFVDDEKDDAEKAAALKAAIKSAVQEVVGDLASAEIRKLRGKVD